jgi:hypothetical protein
MANAGNRAPGYTPELWEKITVVAVSVGIVVLVGWLVLRNQPFADPNLVVILRIIISLAVAVLGATIPGFLQVDWNAQGAVIRAGGALALFVVTYFFSPYIVREEPPESRYARALALVNDVPSYGDQQGRRATNRHKLIAALNQTKELDLGKELSRRIDVLIDLTKQAPEFPEGNDYDMLITPEIRDKLDELKVALRARG